MPDGFALICTPKRARVVTGESLPVAVIANNGDGETDVVLGLPPTQPIVFQLTSDTGAVIERSLAIARAEADGDRARPPAKARALTLAAGASRKFDEDPAAGSLAPIPPGRYQLIARMAVDDGHVVSDEIEIVVEAPVIGSLSTLFCPLTGSHGQAFSTTGETSALYQRETGSVLANKSIFGRCADTGKVLDTAMAAHVAPGLAGRWTAWIDEHGVGAVLSLGDGTVGARPGSAALALESARFVQPGWQRRSPTPTHPLLDGGEAVFMVVGLHDGVPHLQTFVATGKTVTAGEPVLLRGRPASRVLAHHAFPGGPTHLAWAETSAGTTRILVKALDEALQLTSDPARVMFERRSPLRALDMAAVEDGRVPGFVHALFGPEPGEHDDQQLVHVLVPLDPMAGEARVVGLPVPEVPLEACAIAGLPGDGFVVLVKCGINLLSISTSGPRSWRLLATDRPDLHSLRVASTPRGYWAALAADPADGLIVLPNPGFSFEG